MNLVLYFAFGSLQLRLFTILSLGFCLLLPGCATTTDSGVVGVTRSQLMLLPAEKVDAMAVKGYDDLKANAIDKDIFDQDQADVDRVSMIVRKLVPETAVFRSDAPAWQWESHVIRSSEVNAFCMPGGKIIVYSGFLKKVQPTDGELAAVLGHEISHALREHGRERLSREAAQNGVLELLFGIDRWDAAYAGAAQQVTQLLIGLRYDRTQETEADDMGLELMARAGFEPQEAIALWKKMARLGSTNTPEFLSDHPSDEHRQARLEKLLPKVEPLFEAAKKMADPKTRR